MLSYGLTWRATLKGKADIGNKPFSIEAALSYVQGHDAEAKAKAAEYVWRGAEFIHTRCGGYNPTWKVTQTPQGGIRGHLLIRGPK